MAKHVSVQPCFKLQIQRNSFQVKSFAPWNSNLNVEQRLRKSSNGSYNFVRVSTWRRCELSGFGGSKLKVSPPRKTFMEYAYLASLVNVDGTTISGVLFVDQVLLMTSIFLTYMAGVIPVPKSNLPGKSTSNPGAASDSSIFSGSGVKIDDQVNSKYALDVVKGKILDFLDAFEHRKGLGNEFLEFAECQAKQPLSLNAIAEGPRLRLLWASFQLIEEEVKNISNTACESMDDLSKIFSDLIQRSFQPVCMSWLKSELSHADNDSRKAILSLISKKLEEEDGNVLQGIKKSGKEELYAELIHFLSFGSRRDYCYYDHSLYVKHGISILEDLLITLADGITSTYLEFISIDSSCLDEVDKTGLELCTLSTRALQRLRNEVAMNKWMYQNVEAIVSMYEDRFDLCRLEIQPIELPSSRQAKIDSWWMRFTLRRTETVSSQLHYAVIRSFSMPVKRTKELRALRGWRYYFSLLIELSDITMPLIRVVIDKISNGISFFLVCLIGRSLGLIYTGIRQSLKWK